MFKIDKKIFYRISIFLFLLLNFAFKSEAQSYYYFYVKLYYLYETQYNYRVQVSYENSTPGSYEITANPSSDPCYDFLGTDYAGIISFSSINKPISFTLQRKGLAQTWNDATSYTTINYSSAVSYTLYSESPGTQKCYLYVDAPVPLPIAKVGANLLPSENCSDAFPTHTVGWPAYFSYHGEMTKLQVLIDGSWQSIYDNLAPAGYAATISLNDLINKGFTYGNSFKYRFSRYRYVAGANMQPVEEITDGLTIAVYEAFQITDISAPEVCENENPRIDIKFANPGAYIVTFEQITSPEPHQGAGGCLLFKTKYANEVKSIVSKDSVNSVPIGNSAPIEFNPGAKIKIYVELETAVVDSEWTTPPPTTRCAYISPELTIPDLKPTPTFTVPSTKDVTCNGTSTGEIVIALETYSPALETYEAFHDDNNASVSRLNYGTWRMTNLSAKDNYKIKVVCGNGCYSTDTVDIFNPSGGELSATPTMNKRVSCHTNNIGPHDDGEIKVSATGGWGGYTYSKSINGTYSSNNILGGYTLGSYNTYVKDAGGCIYTVPAQQIVLDVSELGISVVTVKNEVCDGGNDGEITYNIDSGSGTASIGVGFNDLFNNKIIDIPPGTYKVRLTNGNCYEETGNVTILPATNITASTTTTNVTCDINDYGSHDNGTITITGSGGWGGNWYRRTKVNLTDDWESWQSSNSFTGLTVGDYTIQIKDANGCDDFKSAVPVSSNMALNITPVILDHADCKGDANGKAKVDVYGGNSNYPGISLYKDAIHQNNTFSNYICSDIKAGKYKILVKDGNNCYNYSTEFDILEPDTALSFTPIISNNISCATGQGTVNDGKISLNVPTNSGWGDYVYSIKKENYSQEAWRSTNIFDSLIEGSHTFYVKDSGGCIVDFVKTINEPDSIEFDATPQIKHQECNWKADNTGAPANGAITIAAKGGNPSYKFYLKENNTDDGTYLKMFENLDSLIQKTFSPLTPKDYYIKVSDSKECSFITGPNELSLKNYTNPQLFDNKVDITRVKCFGQPNGEINIHNITLYADGYGNTAPIKGYYLNWPSPYTKKDSVKTNLTFPITFDTLPAKIDTNYIVYAVDNNNCKSNEIGQEVTQPDELIVTAEWRHNVTCFNTNKNNDDGILFHSIIGGNDSAVGWTRPHVLYKEGVGDLSNTPNGSNFTGLSKGNYKVKYTDTKGCYDESGLITIDGPDSRITAVVNTTLVDCHPNTIGDSGLHNNGTIFLTNLHGGYDPNNDDTYPDYKFAIKQRFIDSDYIPNNEGINNSTFITKKVGYYYIQVTDKEGCEDYIFEDTIKSQKDLIVSGTPFDEICQGDSNGVIKCFSEGGFGARNFFLNSTLAGFTNISPNYSGIDTTYMNLPPVSDYKLTVVDLKGCARMTALNDLEILPYQNPILNPARLKMDSVWCFDGDNGKLTILDMTRGQNIGFGGKSFPFDSIFLKGRISDNQIKRSLAGLPEINILFDNLKYDTCDIYIKDSNNCISNIISPIVKQPDSLYIQIDTIQNVTCYNEDNGHIIYSYNGGNNTSYMPTIFRNTVLNAADHEDTIFYNLAKGTYALNIVDYKGCTATDTGYVDGPNDSIHITYQTTLVDCHINDTGEHINGTISILSTIDGYDPGNNNTYATYNYNIKLADSPIYTRSQSDTFFAQLPVGTHTIKVVDKEGCQNYTFPITVSSNDSLTFSPKTYDEVCENTSNGKIEISTDGGAGKHSYFLFSQDTSGFDPLPYFVHNNLNYAIFNGLPPTNDYQITITDTNNCSQTTKMDSLPIHEYFNPKIEPGNFWSDSVHCYGQANGSVELHGTYGWHHYDTIPFDSIFVLDSDSNLMYVNAFNETLPNYGYTTHSAFRRNDFAWGNHFFRIKDDSACWSNAVSIVVEQPDTLLIHLLDKQHVIAKGEASGVIKFGASGGNSGVQTISALSSSGVYQTLLRTQNTPKFEWQGFVADTFSIKVNDYHNCVNQIDNIIIREPDSLLSFKVISKKDALCKASIGNFTVKGIGGWGDYKFVGAKRISYHASPYFGDLYAGNYRVTVQDSMGATYTDSVVVYEPKDSLLVTLTTIQNPTCGDNGVLTFQIQGGTPHYRLTYVPSDTFNVWSPYQYIAGELAADNYLASVFDSNLCQFDVEATLSDNDRLHITGLSIERYATTDTAPGDGAIKAIVKGGVNNIYHLYPDDNYNFTTTGETSIFTDLLPGIYQFTANSETGCEQSKPIYLPHIYDYPMEVLEVNNETGFGLADGAAMFLVPFDNPVSIILKHNSDPEIGYNLSEGNITYNPADSNLKVDLLAPGNYIAIVTNSTQRVAFAEFHINAYELFEIKRETLVDVIKHDEANGSIKIDCKGGAGQNRYTWVCNSHPGRLLNPVNSPNSTHLNNIQAGSYSLTITDQNNYSLHGSYTLVNPPPIVMAFDKYDVNCKDSADGYVNLSVTGGWGNFQYKVDTALNYANATEIFDLESRSYYFYVVDKRGAIDSILVNIGEPDYLHSLVQFVDSVDCFNESSGTIYFNLSGGTQPYRLKQLTESLWTTDTIDYNLAEGKYDYQFTDKKGCTGIDTLSVYVPQPDSLFFANIDITQTTCGLNNGGIKVIPTGGTTPYQYQWSNTRGQIIGSQSYIDSLNMLEQYNLVVFDYNQCVAKYSQQMNTSTPPTIDSLSITPVLCFGDSTGTAKVIDVTKGYPYAPYFFEWSNGDFGSETQHYNKGNHFVTVFDTNNCATTRWFNVSQPKLLEALVTDSMHVSCYGLNNGYITVKPKGGVGQYRYNWDTGDTVNAISSLYQGNYTLVLSDSNHCTFTKTYAINQPSLLHSQVSYINNLKCKGDTDGKIGFQIQGGTQPYMLKKISDSYWLKATSTKNLPEGNYTYHFADANNCISPDTLTVAIGAPDSLLFEDIDITHTTCNTNNGKIKVSIKGGVTPYSYKWTDMQGNILDTTPDIEQLKQLAQYKVELTDANNCKNYAVKQIKHSTVPRVSKIDTWPVLCWGDTTGRAQIARVDTAFPPAPVSFTWSNQEEGMAANRFYEGDHYVVITDTNGCSSKRYFTVTSPKELTGHLMDYAEPGCFGDTNGYLEIYPQGGVGCYTIKWANGDTHFKADSLATGFHDYVLSDSNGCEFDETVELKQPDLLHAKVTAVDSILCAGDRNGEVTFYVSGGTQPYFYKPLESDIWIQDTKIYQMAEGYYTYAFTDAHNCVGADTLTVDMAAPDSLKFDTLIVNHTTCARDNGSIYFTMKGGTQPYQYEWTNIYREFLSNRNYIDSLRQQAQYWLKVTDKNNCRFKFDKQIYGSTKPTIENILTSDVLCQDDPTGRAEVDSVKPADPFSPYEIYWSNGDTGWVSTRFFSGTHYATVIDSNGCSSVRYFDIKQPNKLEVELVDSSNAICYHASNGFLTLLPKGGAGKYTALWSNGDTTFTTAGLSEGQYSVVVADSNDCKVEQSFEISQPDSILIDLGDDIEICPGTEYTLDGFEFEGHEWILNNELYSDERFAHLSEEGIYTLTVTNQNGCQGADDFVLTIGNSALQADFLMTSQSNLGDTLFITELSNLPLDSMHWAYDEETFLDFTSLDDPAYLLKLKSYNTGIYNMELTAYAGGCVSTQVKQVEILEMDDSTNTFNYMGYNPLIKEMVIGPNPTDGEFLAKITLREVAQIQLTIYSVDYGAIIDLREASGFDYYEIQYNLFGKQSGMYVIMLTVSNERKQTKLILK